jgi:hypothetical protein
MSKVEQYTPEVRDDIPIPRRSKNAYTKKMVDGDLLRIAREMKPGQSVVLPAGSIGKFRKAVKLRNLKTVCFIRQCDDEARVWVVALDWEPESFRSPDADSRSSKTAPRT